MKHKITRWTLGLTKLLWWFAGASSADLLKLPQRTRLQYATLGLVVLSNFVLLCAVWLKVGWTYFGVIGLGVPGLVVPAMLVLGLDRLIAMQPRSLAALGMPDAPGWRPPGREKFYRIVFAALFATLTTFTFMLWLSSSGIQAAHQRTSHAANEPLRQEYLQRVADQAQAAHGPVEAELKVLEEERSELHERLKEQQAIASQTSAKARAARTEAEVEAGGLDGRPDGKKHRWEAQSALADQHEHDAAAAMQRVSELTHTLQTNQSRSAEQRQALAKIATDKTQALAGVEAALSADSRYQPPASGLFADASAFVRLYADAQEGLGRVLFTFILFLVMVAFEACALLGFAVNPVSPLDVATTAGNRDEAARIVAAHTLSAARHRQPEPPIGVQPLGPRPAQRQEENAA